ncbi:hypothetical protein HPB50_003205 [Hyalomma asiaticum]|uniref:Uncharacterized protein n=1 Tax=Hyalomma asiaticum TaxID=266040 RepID=A0ACB7SC66_HYAAI|nr:hypothetical protein HPB50_003205 [Hyalomma asiaticum]
MCDRGEMLGYVKYQDGYRTILPINLIKMFSPKGEDDFDKTKKLQAFWKSEEGVVEGYDPAFVLALADKRRVIRKLLHNFKIKCEIKIDVYMAIEVVAASWRATRPSIIVNDPDTVEAPCPLQASW